MARCSPSSGRPDMRTPIAQALALPGALDAGVPPLDLIARAALEFVGPRRRRASPASASPTRRWPAGGTAPAVLNAANEVAVEAFLDGRGRFTDIADSPRRRSRAFPCVPVRRSRTRWPPTPRRARGRARLASACLPAA